MLARAGQRVAFAVRTDAEAEGIAQPPEMRQLRKRTNLDGVHLSSEGLKPSLSPSHAPALVLGTHTVEAACHELYLTLRRAWQRVLRSMHATLNLAIRGNRRKCLEFINPLVSLYV